MRRYLQLTRAHTAPLEAVPAALGAALATGGLFNQPVLLWTIAGILYHLAGYGQNSYTDWKNGHDQDDPNKEHLPLNTGAVSPTEAKYFTYALFFAFLIYVMYLVYPSPLGLSIALIGMAGGVSYNFIGKSTVLKFLMISVAHTSVFAMAYIDSGGVLMSEIFALSLVYIMLWVTYQISVSGEVKDIVQDGEENFLRDAIWMNVDMFETDDGMYLDIGENVKLYNIFLRTVIVAIGGYIAYSLETGHYHLLLVITLGLVATVGGINLTQSGLYNRNVRLRNMAAVEMLTMYMMVISLAPAIGDLKSLTLIIVSVLWVVVFNKYLWGTVLAPRV